LNELLLSGLTWGDIFGCLRCVVAFAAVLLAPGYCLAWACNLLGFRERGAGERLAWGVALSFGAMTIIAVLLGKMGSFSAVCWLAGVCAVGFVGIVAREGWLRRSGFHIGRWGWAGAGIAAVWILFVVAELVDIGVGSHLYFSVTVVDHALRTAFVDAVLRTGVPPTNPLNWPGHAVPMRYYYFWYVVTAAAARLGEATARQAIIASGVWSGFGLAAVIALYCKNFLGTAIVTRRWPRLAFALVLLTVTGLDILPAIVKALLGMPLDGDMEWWSNDQVTSWMDSLLWVPHHVAGLVCCLLGFLLIWMSKERSRTQKAGCGLLAGLAFASAFGLSIWVAVAVAMVMVAWMGWALLWERSSRERVAVLLMAGVVAVVTLLPYVAELRAEASGAVIASSAGVHSVNAQVSGGTVAQSATHLLRFGVRRVIPAESLLEIGWVARLARSHPGLVELVVRLLLLIPGYFLELGFYGFVLLAAVWAMLRQRLDEAGRTAVVLATAGLVVTTFIRSTVIENNDFGMRSALVVQFFLLLLAAVWWEGGLRTESATVGAGKNMRHRAMVAMAGIGLVGTVYQVAMLRICLLPRVELAERAMALRQGFDAMDARVARNAVVQYNPAELGNAILYAQMLQVGRQTASGQPGCGTAFGGDVNACIPVEEGVKQLFSVTHLQDRLVEKESREPTPAGALSADDARTVCSRLGVEYLVAARWDSVWADRQSWVWTLPKVVDTNQVRVVDCGAPMR
jgi:hypothetical protein